MQRQPAPSDALELGPRFWSKVDRRGPDECWPWLAYRSQGYGRFYFNGRNSLAHRLAYMALVGEIPPELQIDHLCRNRACVNPAHFELVTLLENIRRGEAHLTMKRMAAARTHCRRGHELTPDNVAQYREYRQCRTCSREKQRATEWKHQRAFRARQKEAVS